MLLVFFFLLLSLMCWGTPDVESLGCGFACLPFLGSGWSAGMESVSAALTATLILMHLLGYGLKHAWKLFYISAISTRSSLLLILS